MSIAKDASPYILTVAVDPSADLHAARLVEEVGRRRPDVRFGGFGGAHLRAAGCEVFADPTALSSMVLGFLGHLPEFVALLGRFDRLLVEKTPAAALLVDSPGLNFLMARLARWRGVPVVYYIAPQVWAWAPWRRRKVQQWTDLLLSILPFEVELYREAGVPVEYVGHPLGDELGEVPRAAGDDLRRSLEVGSGRRLIGLFPGSRRQEVMGLMPAFGAILERMELDRDRHRVAVSCFRGDFRDGIEAALRERALDAAVVEGEALPLMMACDLALVASGTASLQLAYFEKPMVVLYRTTGLGRLLFRAFGVTPWIALPNILGSGPNGGAETVREELFSDGPADELAPLARRLLDDGAERSAALERLRRLKDACFRPGAAARAADALVGFLGREPGR